MLDFLYYPVSAVMWFWHQVFGLVLGPSNGVAWALSVVFLVLTLRALMIKPVLSQMRSAQKMRRLAPHIAELRKKHGKDRVKLAEETQKLHREHGVSPLGSFLPALVQVPVFIALLHVLRYFNRPGLSFEQNAALPNYVFGPDEVRSFLEARLFGAPLSSYIAMPQNLLDSFGAHVDRWHVVVVAVPLILAAAVATHVTARWSQRRQQLDPATPGAGIMKLFPWLFPLGVVAGGLFFAFPIAILVYWLTGNAWTLAQQHLITKKLDREEAALPPVVAVAESARGPKPGQKPVAPRPGAKPVTRTHVAPKQAAPKQAAQHPARKEAAPKQAAQKQAARKPGSPRSKPVRTAGTGQA
ncbi:membrane protein insertase YidC [Pseudonocardia ailaonensis]|uniref:Membrane protein insertase YidC n=1 Tax=Pseudonocardia ailaonensis TaxID=367279 RepID=A0ABN2MK80_9PSEU